MSTLDWEEIKNQTYKCARCGHKFKGQECVMRGRLVCPVCGYKILKKVRPPVVKRIRAI